jgi:hypothetical protein
MPARATTLLAAAGLLLAGGAAAADRQTVLGGNGAVYAVAAGSYGALFAGGSAAAAGDTVLALDVARPDAAVERLLVPKTAGGEVEDSPALVYEEASDSLFLVWRSIVNQIHPVLYLASYKDGEWGEVLEVVGNPFAAKSAPQLAVTRDEFRFAGADGFERTARRTVLHLVWWEAGGDGDRINYAPILLLDGAYVGWNPIYSLGELDRPAVEATIGGVTDQLLQAPRVQAGRNDHSVIVSFANPATGRLLVVEATLLAGELSALADGLRAHIIGGGVTAGADLTALADVLRAHIIGGGYRLHRGLLTFIGDDLRAHIIGGGKKYAGAAKSAVADAARTRVIEAGAGVLEHGVQAATAAATAGEPAVERIEELAQEGETATAGPVPLLQLRVLANRPAPHTGAAPTTIYSAVDGRAMLIAWVMGPEIRYIETQGAGWSPILRLVTSEAFSFEQAWKVLERRIHSR